MREVLADGPREELHAVLDALMTFARHVSSILSATSASRRSGRIFTSSGSPSRARVLQGPTLMRPFSASRIFQMS
jgi:hypothetical protein